MSEKDVSIIIPALNEEKAIGLCLESLTELESPWQKFEVIVVDNGSTDRTCEIARSFSGSLDITVLERPGLHVSAVRNAGAALARGRVLAFLDADCLVPSHWMLRTSALLNEEAVGVVGAHFRIPEDAGWIARAWYGKLNSEKQGNLTWVPGCNTWVTRETFMRVGQFDETIETNEDCEFCGRVRTAGLRVVGNSEISVVHLGTPASVWDFYRKISWHATDGLRVFLRNPFLITNARPVLFGFYTLLCLAGIGIGLVLYAFQNGIGVLAGSIFALFLPSLLLSGRLVLRRKQWTDFFPLTILNLVYGIARGRSLLIPRNWIGSPIRL